MREVSTQTADDLENIPSFRWDAGGECRRPISVVTKASASTGFRQRGGRGGAPGDTQPTLGRDTTPVSDLLNLNGGEAAKEGSSQVSPILQKGPPRRLIRWGKLFNGEAQSLYSLGHN